MTLDHRKGVLIKETLSVRERCTVFYQCTVTVFHLDQYTALTRVQRNLICILQTDQILIATQISSFVEIRLTTVFQLKLVPWPTIFCKRKCLKCSKSSSNNLCSIIA